MGAVTAPTLAVVFDLLAYVSTPAATGALFAVLWARVDYIEA